MNFNLHEQRHRSPDVMAKLKALRVTICGAGAVGANVAESLARMGVGALRLIDDDRVEVHNLSTQPYVQADVGAYKAAIIANVLYRAVGCRVTPVMTRLTPANVATLLAGSDLVIDGFDNSASRQAVRDHCAETNTPCLHVGLGDGYAEVVWNEVYRVPSAAQEDVCDYPLARSLVLFAVALACEAVAAYVARGTQESRCLTLQDAQIHPY